jgi:hypothetical protein
MSGYIYEKTSDILTNTVIPRTEEIIQYMPESIFMGTFFIAISCITNIPWWILLLFQVQLIITGVMMGFFINTLFPTVTEVNPNCESGYFIRNKGVKACILNILGKGGSFPSPSLFFISGLITYLYSTLITFKNEITATGEDYSARMITATTFSLILLLIIFVFNIKNGCSTFTGAIGSISLGMIIAFIIYILNSNFFGKELMNLVGLPIISESQ